MIAAVCMGSFSVLAIAITPTKMLADINPPLDLDHSVPAQFGDWHLDNSAVGVVNPQQESLLNRLYSQILARVYVNEAGDRVMVSIAYGKDQRDGFGLHYPEICYPAQGFQITSNKTGSLQVQQGILPVRRLETVLDHRFEAVTYWTMVGDFALLGGIDKKIAEMRYSAKGEIPDGLLFRVSSIDPDSAAAFSLQEVFVKELLLSLDAGILKRLSGLS
jgi:EpsI family protein